MNGRSRRRNRPRPPARGPVKLPRTRYPWGGHAVPNRYAHAACRLHGPPNHGAGRNGRFRRPGYMTAREEGRRPTVEEFILQLPVIRDIAAWVHSGTALEQTIKTSLSHGVWALLAMTAAWRLRRRIEFPVLTPVLILVLLYYAERELRDYAEQGIAKAFDCAMDFAVPAVISVVVYRRFLRHRHRMLGPST